MFALHCSSLGSLLFRESVFGEMRTLLKECDAEEACCENDFFELQRSWQKRMQSQRENRKHFLQPLNYE